MGRTRSDGYLLVGSALVPLLLTPITAVWALLAGPVLLVAGWAGGRWTAGRAEGPSGGRAWQRLRWAGLGICLGVVP